jgi:D-glycero-D-manno-heptose 1,7-bisphosphate phosphatase
MGVRQHHPVTRRAVFLDRDGVVNEAVTREGRAYSPRSLAELVLCDGAADAVRDLHASGFLLVVISNQPDVARGALSRDALDTMHRHLADTLGLDAIYVCAHDNSDQCGCRKPLPGMIYAAATDHAIDLGDSWLIGDRWVDIAAARAAGIRSVLIERDYSWEPTSAGAPPSDLRSTARARDIREAAARILSPIS